MNDEIFLALQKETALSLMQLRARCDALESVVVLLGMKVGWDKEKIQKAIQEATESAHIERQIRAEEKLGPGFAADTFGRPPSP